MLSLYLIVDVYQLRASDDICRSLQVSALGSSKSKLFLCCQRTDLLGLLDSLNSSCGGDNFKFWRVR